MLRLGLEEAERGTNSALNGEVDGHLIFAKWDSTLAPSSVWIVVHLEGRSERARQWRLEEQVFDCGTVSVVIPDFVSLSPHQTYLPSSQRRGLSVRYVEKCVVCTCRLGY